MSIKFGSSAIEKVQKDVPSWGFPETFSWLPSWFPDLSTCLKKGILIVTVIILVLVCGIVLLQCCMTCFTSLVSKFEKILPADILILIAGMQ